MDKLAAKRYALLVERTLAEHKYMRCVSELLEMDMYVSSSTKAIQNEKIKELKACLVIKDTPNDDFSLVSVETSGSVAVASNSQNVKSGGSVARYVSNL